MNVSWHIQSNAGHDTVACEIRRQLASDLLLCDVRLVTQHRDRSAPDTPGIVAYVDEHVLQLGQQLVHRDELIELVHSLETWLHSNEPFSVMFDSDSDQKLSFTVGPDPKLISSRTKPALRVAYHGFAITADWFTTLDETCIRLARDELSKVLRDLH